MILKFFAVLLLSAAVLRADILVAPNSSWQYLKGTAAPPAGWTGVGFNDSAWLRGPAPFYYGENLTGTQLPDMRNGYTTFYVRKTFVVSDPSAIDRVAARLHVDDGCIVWINSIEVTRFNVATGVPAFNGVAEATIEPTWVTNSLAAPSNYLRAGTNVIAAHVLNRPITSSDIVFDLQLESTSDRNPPTIAAMTPSPGKVSELTSVSVRFSEAVQGVSAEDLLVNNQTATSVSGSGDSYTFSFMQPAFGPIDITWEAGHGISDFADPPHPFTSTNWSYLLVDEIAPFAVSTLPPPGLVVRSLSEIEVRFNEPVTLIRTADLLLNGQAATNLLPRGTVGYVFQFPAAPAGTAQVAWAANQSIADFASNKFAGGSWTYTVDPTLPDSDVIISEFLASAENAAGIKDEDGELQDWIEIYNRGNVPASLAGWSLTDDPEEPALWIFPNVTVPAGGRLVVFASAKDRKAGTRLHTNFKLSNEGEYLALYNTASPRQAVSEFRGDYPVQRDDYSYGLDVTGAWRYYQIPTPGQANGASTISGIVPDPETSQKRGYVEAPFLLSLTNDLPGSTFRYTLNGSPPTQTTGRLYSGPFLITNTTVIRAAAFRENLLPSKVVTHSYIFLDQVLRQPNNPPGYPVGATVMSGYPSDYEMDPEIVNDPAYSRDMKAALQALPVLSIAIKVDDMFGAANGIYTHPLSRGPQWERPCSVEFIPAGEDDFQVDCGIQIQGNAAREPIKQPKHPMRITFKGDYGVKSLNYRMFSDSPVDKFDTLILRADFNYSWLHWNPAQRVRAQRVRDSWMKDSMRAMGGVASRNRYVHLYINGLYWGIYDPSERPDGSFGEAYFGGDKTDYDVINEGAVVDGTATAYNQLLGITDVSTTERYNAVKQLLDIPQFIDYMLLHFYVGHEDWFNNKNWYAIRPKDGSRGFFYVPWDGEMVLGDSGVNRVATADLPSGLHPKLVGNAQYRLDFADRIHQHFFNDGALTPARNIARWQKRLREIELPIIAESARWGDYRRDVHQHQNPPYELYTRDEQWRAEQNRLINSYFPNRTATVLNQLRNANLYPNVTAPTLSLNGARLRITAPAGTIHYTTDGSDPRVYGTGAIAPGARAYSNEIVLNESTRVRARVLANGVWSALAEEVYSNGLRFPLRVTEIMYNPNPPGDAFEFIELQNVGSLPFDATAHYLEGVDYVFPPNSVIQPGQMIVLASSENPTTFAARYPGLSVFGRFSGQLVNRGERLAFVEPDGRTAYSIDYSDDRGWPKAADGDGFSLEIIDPIGNPDDPANWHASAVINGSPGKANSGPSIRSIRINEILAKSLTGPDWIELYNGGTTTVDISGWSLAEAGNTNRYVFPASTTLAQGAYLKIDCDGIHAPFALSSEGETIILRNALGDMVHLLSFGSQVADYSFGYGGLLCTPTPNSPNRAIELGDPSQVMINEWLANALTGEADWIELFNPAPQPVSLQGCWLEAGNEIFEITAPTFIAANGHVRLYADTEPGLDHVDFKLPAAGTTLTLSAPEGATLDRVTYAAQSENVSQGRFPDGSANIISFPLSASPAAPNTLNFPIRHAPATDGFRVMWDARVGARYRVEFSSDLISWATLGEIAASSARAEAKDSAPTIRRYYRVVALP